MKPISVTGEDGQYPQFFKDFLDQCIKDGIYSQVTLTLHGYDTPLVGKIISTGPQYLIFEEEVPRSQIGQQKSHIAIPLTSICMIRFQSALFQDKESK